MGTETEGKTRPRDARRASGVMMAQAQISSSQKKDTQLPDAGRGSRGFGHHYRRSSLSYLVAVQVQPNVVALVSGTLGASRRLLDRRSQTRTTGGKTGGFGWIRISSKSPSACRGPAVLFPHRHAKKSDRAAGVRSLRIAGSVAHSLATTTLVRKCPILARPLRR